MRNKGNSKSPIISPARNTHTPKQTRHLCSLVEAGNIPTRTADRQKQYENDFNTEAVTGVIYVKEMLIKLQYNSFKKRRRKD